jgi:hypothetical protein
VTLAWSVDPLPSAAEVALDRCNACSRAQPSWALDSELTNIAFLL